MIVVILAAGKGNRLKKTLPESFSYKTKAIIPINNEPAIKSLSNQFLNININNLLFVLGHEYKSVREAFQGQKIKFVLNNNFQNDSNLRSLYLAFRTIIKNKIYDFENGVLVIEADSFLPNEVLLNFIKHINLLNYSQQIQNKICWTARGYSKSDDSGGFIDPFTNNSNINKNFGEVKNVYIKSKPNNSCTNSV